MKRISIFDLVFAPIPLLKDHPFRLQQFAEGTIHFSSHRAAYLQPPPKIGQRRVLNVHGEFVWQQFPIMQPWRRVTPKAVKPGQARRLWLAEQRANA